MNYQKGGRPHPTTKAIEVVGDEDNIVVIQHVVANLIEANENGVFIDEVDKELAQSILNVPNAVGLLRL